MQHSASCYSAYARRREPSTCGYSTHAAAATRTPTSTAPHTGHCASGASMRASHQSIKGASMLIDGTMLTFFSSANARICPR